MWIQDSERNRIATKIVLLLGNPVKSKWGPSFPPSTFSLPFPEHNRAGSIRDQKLLVGQANNLVMKSTTFRKHRARNSRALVTILFFQSPNTYRSDPN